MFSCILYHYSKLLHKKLSHAQKHFDITTKRYDGKPHVSQTFYIDWLVDWLIADSVSHVESEEDREQKEGRR